MKNPSKSTSSANCRYFVPSLLLASQVTKGGKKARKKTLKPAALTYLELIQAQEAHVARGSMNKQTAANRATALRLFLRSQSLLPEDAVGDEMRIGYALADARFAETLRADGRSSRSISNLRAALKPWRISVAEDDTYRAQSSDYMTPFQKAITELVAQHPVKTFARKLGVPAFLIRTWMKGGRPLPSSAPHIRRLESFFGMERESLVLLSGIQNGKWTKPSVGQAAPNAYRARLAVNRKLRYVLRVSPDSPLAEEWSILIRYKTDPVPFLKRLTRGTWTFSPHKLVARPSEWFAFEGGREVPSAGKCWGNIASFYGWLSLSKENGGLGMPTDALQTLAWLAIPDYTDAYLRWRMQRSGDKMTQGMLEILAVMTWMVRPDDGYLYQQSFFQQRLPEKYRAENWQALCARQYEHCQRLQAFWKDKAAISRNSFDSVRAVIDSPEPLEEIADMVQRMRNDRPRGDLKAEAIWARDILIIKLLTSNPLRMRNVITLTWNESNVDGYRPDQEGSVYKRVDGSWWISIGRLLFKNRGASLRDYDSPIHESVWPDLERYLFKYRPLLLRWPTDLLILTKTRDPERRLTSKGKPYKQEIVHEHRPYRYIGNQVAKLTARYLRNSDGSRMHAFRNIVTTAILKAEGGDIKTAALVLHDKETTVEKHYSGMRSGDGNKRMGELLNKSFKRM
jgi:hypothetical protein